MCTELPKSGSIQRIPKRPRKQHRSALWDWYVQVGNGAYKHPRTTLRDADRMLLAGLIAVGGGMHSDIAIGAYVAFCDMLLTPLRRYQIKNAVSVVPATPEALDTIGRCFAAYNSERAKDMAAHGANPKAKRYSWVFGMYDIRAVLGSMLDITNPAQYASNVIHSDMNDNRWVPAVAFSAGVVQRFNLGQRLAGSTRGDATYKAELMRKARDL